MKPIFFIYILLLVVFSDCFRNKDTNEFTKFPVEFNLEGHPTNIKEIYKTGILSIYDSLLFITNTYNNEKQIHIYDKNSFRYLKSAGQIGRGPGEISNPFLAAIDTSYGEILFLDMGIRKILRFNIDSILLDENYKPHNTIPIPDQSVLISFAWYAPGLISYLDSRYDYLVSVMDFSGNTIDSIQIRNTINEFKEEDLSFESLQAYYYYSYNTSRNKIAIVSRFSDLLCILDKNSNVLKKLRGPDFIFQVPDVRNLHQIITTNYLVTDNKYIYCLYLNKARLDTETRMIPNYANTIHIFDWEGNPVAKVTLDYPVISFVIDSENQQMITFCPTMNDIISYDLNKLKLIY